MFGESSIRQRAGHVFVTNTSPNLWATDMRGLDPGELAQNVGEDAAVAVVIRLTGRVDPHDGVEAHLAALVPGRANGDRPRGPPLVERRDACHRERLGAVQTERVGRLLRRE